MSDKDIKKLPKTDSSSVRKADSSPYTREPVESSLSNKNIPANKAGNADSFQRIELPGGGYGVYMGETGKEQTAPRGKRPRNSAPRSTPPQGQAMRRNGAAGSPNNSAAFQNAASGNPSALSGQRNASQNGRPADKMRYALSDTERQEIERRHAMARAKRRAAAEGRVNRRPDRKSARPTLKDGVAKYVGYYFRYIVDRVYMAWMGISIDLDTIIKSLIIAGMILLFAMLQTTVFARFAPFGATPDLMLALVIAVGTTEGERWGGATGLASAFLIECLGGTGITLLPLLYVPAGYAVGVLCTNYLRDSVIIRLIYTGCAGILRAVITAIYVAISYEKVDVGLMFTSILIPEYFSTALMSFLPHVTEWFALKAFHKSRDDRISS